MDSELASAGGSIESFAITWLLEGGTLKDMGKATAKVVNIGDKTSMKITLEPGFDWIKEVSPKLPGCPEWCPANHFGYLESGSMKIKYQDGSTATVNAGGSYLIPPGHLPEDIGDVPWCENIPFLRTCCFFLHSGNLLTWLTASPYRSVMVEFSQSTAQVVKDMKD